MTQFADLKIPTDTWTDVHAALSIASGTEIQLQNIGPEAIRIVVAASAPTQDDIGLYVLPVQKSLAAQQQVGIAPDVGEVAWAKTSHGITKSTVSVQEV